MWFPYAFTSPDEAQLQRRRQLFDAYGQFAQISVLIPLVLYRVPFIFRFISSKFHSSRAWSKTKEHSSPLVSRFDEQSVEPERIESSSWRKVRWHLDQDVLPSYGTWRVVSIATLWTIWLVFLAVKDTGDGMSISLFVVP